MNRTICYWISWALLTLLVACKPQGDVVSPSPTPDPTPSTSTTPTGQPQGSSTSQVIDSQGGSITTADGNVQLSVPAGALNKSTTITIQPITNYAPNGLGLAYRFSPDGIQFAKPAMLTFHYDIATVTANDSDLLRVAYQNSNQYWQETADITVDTASRQITVLMPHFSDWSVYEITKLEMIAIDGGQNYLDLGASTQMNVKQSEVEPLVNAKNESLRVDYSQVKWSVLGGDVNGQIKATAERTVYTAPGKYPPQNPITVVAEVPFQSSRKKAYLLKRILIGKDYFTGTFGGSAFNWSELSITKSDQFLIINGNSGTQSLNMLLRLNDPDNIVGSYPYTTNTKPGTALAEYAVSYGAYDGYMSFLYECDWGEKGIPPLVSGANVTISQFDDVHGVTYVRGKLGGTFFNLPGLCPAQVRKQSIQGEFRIRLTN